MLEWAEADLGLLQHPRYSALCFFNKVSGLRTAILLRKETLAEVFFCQFCKISKKTFSYRTPLVTASENAKEKLDQHFLSK